MAPAARCSRLALLAAAAVAVAAAAAPAPAAAAWWSLPDEPHRECGSCGTATWLGRCVPAPAACAATPGAVCTVRAGAATHAAAGAWWWRPQLAYDCVSPPRPATSAAVKVAQRYLATIRRVYEPLKGLPEQVAGFAITATAPNGTFAAAPVGRIRPLGVFTDLPQTLEYFYGITSAAGLRLLDFEITQFVASPPYAFAKVDLPTISMVTNATATASHIGLWRFDEADRITGYDLDFAGITPALAVVSVNYSSPIVVRQGLIPRLCASIQQLCTGGNQVYDSTEACVRFLTPLPVRRFEEGNIVACRAYHAPLARFRPDVHCAHVGPSGGGKCVDKPFESMYEDDVKMLGLPWMGPELPMDEDET